MPDGVSGGPLSQLSEGILSYGDAYARNKAWAKPSADGYATTLSPPQEKAFRGWIAQNNVPFDPNATVSDYDMRGFYKALIAGDPRAKSAVDPNDGRIHYPDYWKTPYDATFSNQSQWATREAPHWDGNKLVSNNGVVLFNDASQRPGMAQGGTPNSLQPPSDILTPPSDLVGAPAQAPESAAGARALEPPSDLLTPPADLVTPDATKIAAAPKGASDDDTLLGAAAAGFKSGISGVEQTAQTVAGEKPTESAAPAIEAAQPMTWGDFLHPTVAAKKAIYGLAQSSPTMAGAVIGGTAGAAIPVLGETGVGEVLGSAAGAAAGTVAQTLGPQFAAELKKTPDDPNGAFDRAVKSSALQSGVAAVAYPAFGWAPFKNAVKDVLFQAFAVQPAISATGQALENVAEGKPVGQGVAAQLPGAVAGTLAPAVAHGAVQLGVEHFLGRTAEEPPPDAIAPAGAPQTKNQRPMPPATALQDIEKLGGEPETTDTPAEAQDLEQRQRLEAIASGNPPLPTGPVSTHPGAPTQITPSTPEPSSDIRAQIGAMLDPKSAKDSVFVADANQADVPANLPGAVHRVPAAGGTLLTTDADKAAAFRNAPTDETLARVLGYPEAKGDVLGTSATANAVQALDRNGSVVGEALASPGQEEAAAAALAPQAPGGDLRLVTPEEAQTRRESMGAEEAASAPPGLTAEEMRVATAAPEEGTAAAPVDVQAPEDMAVAARHVETEPTDAQTKAGTYAKGHIRFQGLPVSIENPEGSVRSGVDADGKPWSAVMPVAYGYIKRAEGADGDHVDAFVGRDPKAPTAYVIDQRDRGTGAFDEHKAMLGFPDQESALAAYRAAYPNLDATEQIMSVTPMPMDVFKHWLRVGDTKSPVHAQTVTMARVIDDILGDKVRPRAPDVAVRYRISEKEAAKLLDDISLRPDTPIEIAKGKTELDSEKLRWRRLDPNARERRIHEYAGWAWQHFGMRREDFPSDAAFMDALKERADAEAHEHLLPIISRAQELGLHLTDDEARDVEGDLANGVALDDAIEAAFERGAMRQEGALAGAAQESEESADEWKEEVAPHPELAPRPVATAGGEGESAAGDQREPAGRSPEIQPGTPPHPPEAPEQGARVSQQTDVAPSAAPETRAPQEAIAREVADRIRSSLDPENPRKPLTARDLQEIAERAYGAKLSEGKFDRSDMYDALELGVNLYIDEDQTIRPSVSRDAAILVAKHLEGLKKDILPTQTVRAGEKETHQQFSTPPDYSYAVTWAADIRPQDSVLEPSAGTGSLLVMAKKAHPTELIANEISARRAALVNTLGPTRMFTEDAEQLHNALPDEVAPTVVVMNPPFSQTAGRLGSKRDINVGARHIEQALARLAPGGRLVAIVGRGMAPDAPAFREWWKKISDRYDVRANVGVAGSIFHKYGTDFGTRTLVVDKAPPSGRAPVTGDVANAADLIKKLSEVRNDRPAPERAVAGEQVADQPGGRPLAAEGAPGGEPAAALHSPTDLTRPGSEIAGAGPGGELPVGPGHSGRALAEPETGPGEDHGVAREQSERPGDAGTVGDIGARAAAREDVAGSGTGGNSDVLRAPSGGERPLPTEPDAAAVAPSIKVDEAAADPQTGGEITEDVYEPYRPQRVAVEGARPHPGELVQSAAMASVMPPKPSYAPKLPKKLVDGGALSDAQLETIIYAGQAHSQFLPSAEGETKVRKGLFVGDGTGVGKGREIAGIMMDNWHQGRNRHVWVSENRPLINDAKRDWSALGGSSDDIFDLSKTSGASDIKAKRGILFASYDTLKSAAKGEKLPDGSMKPGKRRLDQIIDWLGHDFDGVIALDEAHNLANSMAMKGDRGIKAASAKALAGIELQQKLPNARIVYVSATGATEVSNLAYAERLGLWGRGTAFPTKGDFISQVSSGGIAAMELVARDMKALGQYVARNLSYRGVDYNRLEHPLTDEQRAIYDKLAEGWQVVLQNMNEALKLTNADRNGDAKKNAMSAFWGSHQRFFNQVLSSMQMPTVVKSVERDLAEHRQVVMQLVNTNEASQERALAKLGSEDELEDLDMTPRDQLLQMVEHSFPVQQFEEYVDDNGNQRSRPVTRKDGTPVLNKDAVAMRDRLLDDLSSIRVPDGPLEMILNHFGVDKVAEVTGRKRRVVRKPDDRGETRTVIEPRPGSANVTEADAFQNAKKPILIFSQAGGTGRSYHAENGTPSADMRRSHYLVQAGWRADKAIQGFGRTHRTNEASQPIFHLVTTDLSGQKRFISSIARRLSQLGALTKGERRTGDQGLFSSRDNLESPEARDALYQFYLDLHKQLIPDLSIGDFEQQTGLRLVDPATGDLYKELPGITQFLNRLLSLKIDTQNRVFGEFSGRLDDVIARAAAAGTLDTGLETVRADKVRKVADKVVHVDPATGAETRYVSLELQHRNHPLDFETTLEGGRYTGHTKPAFFVRNRESGRIYAAAEARPFTDAQTGQIVEQYRLASPLDYRLTPRHTIDGPGAERRWEKIPDMAQAKSAWDAAVAATPEYRKEPLHLITGAILPIWDRLRGNTKVYRLQTDAGERLLGRVIDNKFVPETLRALGAEHTAEKVTPHDLAEHLIEGGRAALANGWTLKRAFVAGQRRIELVGPNFTHETELRNDGVFRERVDGKIRYFVPAGDDAAKVLERITERRPVTDMGSASSEALQAPTMGDERPTDADAGAPRGWSEIEGEVRQRLWGSATGVLRPAESFLRHENELASRVSAAARQMFPGARDLAVSQMRGHILGRGEVPVWGAYGSRGALAHVLAWSLDAPDPEGVIRHEGIHFLRRSGILTDKEWGTLAEAAEKNDWVGKHDIARRYPQLEHDLQIEEAVADEFSKWRRGETQTSGPVARIFRAIGAFLQRVGMVARQVLGRDATASDIMSRIESGDIGRRMAPADAEPAREAAQAPPDDLVPPAQPPLLPTKEASADELAARERRTQKEEAELRMRGRKGARKGQEPADTLPLFGSKGTQGDLFQAGAPDEDVREEPTPEETNGPLGSAAARARPLLERAAAAARELWEDVQMKVAPMAAGSDAARAVAKDFANASRLNRYEFDRIIKWLGDEFTPDQLRDMWNAADEQSVAEQEGRDTKGIGLDRLDERQRVAVDQLQAMGKGAWKAAVRRGMVKGPGLPSYVPRMLVEMADEHVGRVPSGATGAPTGMDRVGMNLRTKTAQMLHRGHLTTEETEAAAREKLGRKVVVARDIRSLAVATRDLQDALAGRALIDAVRKIGKATAQDLVSDAGEPADSPYRWFTLQDHPSFKTRVPAKLERNPETGEMEPVTDADGNVVTKKVPIYVRGDFEGPLRAVLSRDTGRVYNAMMAMKGATMSAIMYSPLIHNAVEWGRALPAMPGKVLTFKAYFEGNRARNDAATMREAINAGLVPIGRRFGYQDISSIMEEPNIAPGRSFTAKLLGAVPSLFDPRAGDAVKRAIDNFGDLWHNTLLWDRVADLQMGLYVNFREHEISRLEKSGLGPDDARKAATTIAAHLANRYAGALPLEAMSSGARKFANLAFFSRTFTLGNLGALKDMVRGLPKDVQAQLSRDIGDLANKTARSVAARKAVATIALDVALFHIANAGLQSAIAMMLGGSSASQQENGYLRRLNGLLLTAKENPLDLLNPFADVTAMMPQADNEPGKQDVIYVGRAADGTAIYMRNPVGKIGEEMEGWLTSPLDMLRRKEGTVARPLLQTIMNTNDFGNKLYDPYANTPAGWVDNIGRVVTNFFGDQVPLQAIRAARDYLSGIGDRGTEAAQIVGPLAGFTFSKGFPGGPQFGLQHFTQEEYELHLHEHLPSIRRQIKEGDIKGAQARMTALHVPVREQSYIIAQELYPRAALSRYQRREFEEHATAAQQREMGNLSGTP